MAEIFEFHRRINMETRRKILQTGCLAIGSVPFPSLASVDSNPKCTLGFSTYGMRKLKTEQAIQVLSKIGFQAIEIAVRSGWDADSAKLSQDRRTNIRHMLANSPLQLTSFMEHLAPTDQKKQWQAIERLKMAADLAHDLGTSNVPLIQTTLGGGKFSAMKGILLQHLAEWIELANKEEVTIAIKPHRGGAVSQPIEAAWLFHQLKHPPRLKMVYDYSHYIFRDMEMEDTIQTALPHTVHVAVKDALQENGRVLFKLPGETGNIDFVKMLNLFHKGGYRGDFNCEVSSMVSGMKGYDPISAARICHTNMTRAFKEAGLK
jgi:sugar phosphate isomerase/epimerase